MKPTPPRAGGHFGGMMAAGLQRDPGFVSVITVCRNAAATLEACIESVATQSWPHIEHIIIDGASTIMSSSVL